MLRFDDERYYVTTDSELQLLGTPAALANQRSRGEGPRYLKLGKRVLYRGRDLNAYLDECVIEPTCRRGGNSDRSEAGTDAAEAAAGFTTAPRERRAQAQQRVEAATGAA